MTPLFIRWMYIENPGVFWRALKDLILGLSSYFSVSLLTSTLAAPWRHDSVDMSRLPIHYWFQAIVSNLVSRFVGLVVRSLVVGAGLAVMAVAAMGGIVLILAWYLLPVILLASFLYGFQLILGGLSG